MKVRALQSVLALALAAAAPLAAAYEQGTWLSRFGAATVTPQETSYSALGDIARVDAATSLGVSFTYMANPSVGLEVLAALPFTHDIEGKGALEGISIGETQHLPPTVSLQWYPAVNGNLQPYFGVGINFTSFFNEETSQELTTALSATSTGISLDPSWGLAMQAGIDYAIGDKWLVNAAVWSIDIETKGDVTVNGANFLPVEVSIDPIVVMVGAGYRF